MSLPGQEQPPARQDARDFPEVYKALGIDTSRMGCIFLDLEAIPESLIPPEEWGYDRGFAAARQPHSTLLYGLLHPGPEIAEQVDAVLADWERPYTIRTEGVLAFDTPAHVAFQPIVLKVGRGSQHALYEANQQLQLLPHIRTFRDYNPHITIGYADKAHVDKVMDFYAARNTYIQLDCYGINYGE